MKLIHFQKLVSSNNLESSLLADNIIKLFAEMLSIMCCWFLSKGNCYNALLKFELMAGAMFRQNKFQSYPKIIYKEVWAISGKISIYLFFCVFHQKIHKPDIPKMINKVNRNLYIFVIWKRRQMISTWIMKNVY